MEVRRESTTTHFRQVLTTGERAGNGTYLRVENQHLGPKVITKLAGLIQHARAELVVGLVDRMAGVRRAVGLVGDVTGGEAVDDLSVRDFSQLGAEDPHDGANEQAVMVSIKVVERELLGLCERQCLVSLASDQRG
jgi:hypothetical protein